MAYKDKNIEKEYCKKWRKDNPEYMKEYNKKYYIENKNKENYINTRKKYKKNNPEAIKKYNKQYYKEHSEIIKERTAKWRKDNPEHIKKYRKNNSEAIKEQKKQYRKDNREHIKEYNKQWRKNNLEHMKEYDKQYYKEHPKQIRRRQRQYQNNKRKTNLKCNLNIKISSAIRKFLKKNKAGRHWEALVGYTIDDLILRLKHTMPKDYCWDDYINGKLHIDHIIPISKFDYDSPEQINFQRCWALNNLRLLPARENIIKSDKLLEPFQTTLKI